MKKVPLTLKPSAANRPATADDWVNASAATTADLSPVQTPPENIPMKRLTIDVSEELHTRIKANCALKGVKMADEIRALLDEHFPAAQ